MLRAIQFGVIGIAIGHWNLVVMAQEDAAVAKRGTALAVKYCYSCHDAEDDYYNILDHDQLIEEKYVVKGEPDESELWKRLSDTEDPMPPEDEPKPSAAEKQDLLKWINAGAPLLPQDEIEHLIAAKPDANSGDLATRGTALMEKYCYDCHGGKATKAKLDIFAPDLPEKFTGGGDPDKSKIWRLVSTKKMPKRGSPMPSDEEIAVIREWIADGYAISRSEVSTRAFISVESEMAAIAADLDSLRESDQPFVRYLTLRNVHNNFKRYSNEDLDAHRGAIAKVINSMSWSPRITAPKPVDEFETLYRIDLRDYQWDRPEFHKLYGYTRIGVWNLLCSEYPYGLSHANHEDQQIRELNAEINRKMQLRGQFPVLRADWLCFHATQTEVYYLIMGIPANVGQLEHSLGVNLESDFRQRRLHRFALKESGVSVGNRLMDRHMGRVGPYWISYDFKEGGDRNDLRRFPLGPFYDNHPHKQFAFEHDGGEIIFSLPNGMQGYALTDEKGNLLKNGPIQVVQDEFQATGDAVVTNAISCMKCHASGMKSFQDDIISTIVLQNGEARRFAEDLYDPRKELASILESDGKRFLDAFAASVKGVTEIPPAWLEPNGEPVGRLAVKYMSPLDAFDALTELDIESRENGEVIFRDSALLEFGLRALSDGQVVKRSEWETRNEGGDSIYQKAAVVLERGETQSYSHTQIKSMLKEFIIK